MKGRPKISSFIGKLVDPFIVLGIFALFLIPAVTVFNLTPVQFNKSEDDSILGVEESTLITFIENTDVEDGISVSEFEQTDDNNYRLKISHLTHTIGNYRNLIFTAENPTEDEKNLRITSSHEITDPGIKVSLLENDTSYILLKEDGTLYPVSIYIKPEEKVEISLSIESPIDVNFTSYIDLNIFVD
jgi:hypothetical protein